MQNLVSKLKQAIVTAFNPSTHPTTPNSAAVTYLADRVGGYPAPLPFLGGLANGVPIGVFYIPRVGDEVTVAQEPTGRPIASISSTTTPTNLPTGVPGDLLVLGAAGAAIAFSAAGAITITPATGQTLSLKFASSAVSSHETVTLTSTPSGTVVAAPPDGRIAMPVEGVGTVFVPYYTS